MYRNDPVRAQVQFKNTLEKMGYRFILSHDILAAGKAVRCISEFPVHDCRFLNLTLALLIFVAVFPTRGDFVVQVSMLLTFDPVDERPAHVKVWLNHQRGHEKLDLKGQGGVSRLVLFDSDMQPLTHMQSIVNFGMCAKNKSFRKTMFVGNLGSLQGEFFLRRNFPPEFSASPLNGVVAPGGRVPLSLCFEPMSDSQHDWECRLSDNNKTPFSVRVRGSGGDGQIAVHYLTKRDHSTNGLDFDIVPSYCYVVKRVVVHNTGNVLLRLTVSSSHPAFTVAMIGIPQPHEADFAARCNSMGQAATTLVPWQVEQFERVVDRVQQAGLCPPEALLDAALLLCERNGEISTKLTVASQALANAVTAVPLSDVALEPFVLGSFNDDVTSDDSAAITAPAPTASAPTTASDASATTDVNALHEGKGGASTTTFTMTLGAREWAIVACTLCMYAPQSLSGVLNLTSEYNSVTLPLTVRGGKVVLSHDGNCNFGTVATRRPYTRRIVVYNKGTLTTKAKLYWSVPGLVADQRSRVELGIVADGNRARVWWYRVCTVVRELIRYWRKKHGSIESLFDTMSSNPFRSPIEVAVKTWKSSRDQRVDQDFESEFADVAPACTQGGSSVLSTKMLVLDFDVRSSGLFICLCGMECWRLCVCVFACLRVCVCACVVVSCLMVFRS